LILSEKIKLESEEEIRLMYREMENKFLLKKVSHYSLVLLMTRENIK
jgi:hypothetical protein